MAQLIRDVGGLGYSERSITNHSSRIIKKTFGISFEDLKKKAHYELIFK